ncbi:flagellar basal body-associated FliL family protein [Acidisphaera sp. S103]|uniref:flagellar basal body-associated FliL family protein n=1 Tax=Acidisphaera sp. S103 TaxID=1747223 RepID=UPI00131CC4D6|nr:flagellar basal body-associated FliL family protein [Acidisphaera sp. S103]
MSSARPIAQKTTEAPPKASRKRKLVLIAVPAGLLLTGAGLWFSGVLPRLLGMDRHDKQASEAAKPVPPSYVDIPEMIGNLSDRYRPHYVKLAARLVVPKPDDVVQVTSALPRVQNLLTIYMRDMKPEELHDSADTDRLLKELLTRVNAAVAPAKVSDVLFTQLLVQ